MILTIYYYAPSRARAYDDGGPRNERGPPARMSFSFLRRANTKFRSYSPFAEGTERINKYVRSCSLRG